MWLQGPACSGPHGPSLCHLNPSYPELPPPWPSPTSTNTQVLPHLQAFAHTVPFACCSLFLDLLTPSILQVSAYTSIPCEALPDHPLMGWPCFPLWHWAQLEMMTQWECLCQIHQGRDCAHLTVEAPAARAGPGTLEVLNRYLLTE